MKYHVRKSPTYPMNFFAICSHNSKNTNGFVMLECVDPKTFIALNKKYRCKHCEKALNKRRAKKHLTPIIWEQLKF